MTRKGVGLWAGVEGGPGTHSFIGEAESKQKKRLSSLTIGGLKTGDPEKRTSGTAEKKE